MKRNMNFTLHILSFSSCWILAQGDALTLWDLWAKLVKHLEFCVSLLHMSPDSFKSQLRTEVMHVRRQEVTEHFGFMVISTWCRKRSTEAAALSSSWKVSLFFRKGFLKEGICKVWFLRKPTESIFHLAMNQCYHAMWLALWCVALWVGAPSAMLPACPSDPWAAGRHC